MPFFMLFSKLAYLLLDGTEHGIQLIELQLADVQVTEKIGGKRLELLGRLLGHDGVLNTTADDIAAYYIANCYDQVSSWIAEREAQQ